MRTVRPIESRYVVNEITGCWEWSGYLSNGYGYMRNYWASPPKRGKDGKVAPEPAHRVVYELHKGPIPKGLTIDHLCRNRGCVNPDHLEPVSQRTNVLRGTGMIAQQVARTQCPRGHELAGANLSIWRGHRSCRTCWRLNRRAQIMRERPDSPHRWRKD